MQYNSILAMGRQLQRQNIKHGLSTIQLYEILKKRSNVIHDNVIRNYMKILKRNDFIIYINGLWYILSEKERNKIISKKGMLDKDITVFARKDGKHFHKNRDCMFVDSDYEKVTLKEAKTRNLYPCPNCVCRRGVK